MKRKKIVRFAAWGIAAALVAWGVSAIAVYWVSAGRVFDKASDVPHCRAAVVLGCRKALPNGLLNLYFTRRIAAAADLYKAGKVDCLIVSGDNHIKEYDEASDMKESLAERAFLRIASSATMRDFARLILSCGRRRCLGLIRSLSFRRRIMFVGRFSRRVALAATHTAMPRQMSTDAIQSRLQLGSNLPRLRRFSM